MGISNSVANALRIHLHTFILLFRKKLVRPSRISGFHLPFAQPLQQTLHSGGYETAVVKLVVKVDEGDECLVCAARVELVLVQAVSFAHLSFHSVAVNGVPEPALCHTYEHLSGRLALGTRYVHVNHPQGKGAQSTATTAAKQHVGGLLPPQTLAPRKCMVVVFHALTIVVVVNCRAQKP